MIAPRETSVLVAGAGPVGMCAAIDLAMRGIDVVVIEPRGPGEPPSAKCNTVAARTMETFRRFGVAEQVRAAGLPDDYPTDTIFSTSLTGHEMCRIRMPARSERNTPGFADSHWRSAESMVRISQIYLEPILFAKLISLPNVTVLNRTEVVRYEQDGALVRVVCRPVDGGSEQTIAARFLIGADGGRSTIRRAMGVKLTGDAEISWARSSLIRAPGLGALFGNRRRAWMTWVANHKVRGVVVAIDGKDIWLVHRALPRGVTDFESIDRDQSLRDVLGVGPEFQYEVLNHEDWVGRRLVAERFRDDRVFIAGDAAHLWVPFAGYGMNAGIADAVNLSWLISGVLKGWADHAILDAYQAERQPITDQVSRLAIAKVQEVMDAAGARSIPAVLSSGGPVGAFLRKVLGRKLHRINVPQFAPEGLNFGYYYDRSPIIAYDGATPPAYTMGTSTPSTVPGCRLPHFKTPDDRSIYDQLGPDYTLLRFSPAAVAEPLLTAAQQSGLPMTLIDAKRPADARWLRHALLLVRSDQHVVWRANAVPKNCAALVAKLSGRPSSTAT